MFISDARSSHPIFPFICPPSHPFSHSFTDGALTNATRIRETFSYTSLRLTSYIKPFLSFNLTISTYQYSHTPPSQKTAAAKALLDRDDMDAEQIAHKAMSIAAEICVYTNNNFVTEVIGGEKKKEHEEDALEKAGKK